MVPDFQEVGTGIALGVFKGYNREMATEDFAYTTSATVAALLTAWLRRQSRHEGLLLYPGEGLGNVTIVATRAPTAPASARPHGRAGPTPRPACRHLHVTASGPGLPATITSGVRIVASNIGLVFHARLVYWDANPPTPTRAPGHTA